MGAERTARVAPVERVGRVRGFRAAPAPATTLCREVSLVMEGLTRRRRALGAVGERWAVLVPGMLAGRAWPEAVRRGSLTVRAVDAAAGFEFDRWLRGGGTAVLRGVGVSRVRVVAG